MRKILLAFLMFATACKCSKALAAEPVEAMPIMSGEGGGYFMIPGKVRVLEFYYDNCAACNANATNVKALHKAWKESEAVHVLDVGIDSKDSEYAQWIERHKPEHMVLKDVDRRLFRSFVLRYVPTTIVLDCDLKETYRHVGVWDADTKEALNLSLVQAVSACKPQGDK